MDYKKSLLSQSISGRITETNSDKIRLLTQKRLENEKKDIDKENKLGRFPESITKLAPSKLGMSENYFEWDLIFHGKGPLWGEGIFHCKLLFPNVYHLNPPLILFERNFKHVHVYADNKACIDLINPETWSGDTRIANIARSIVEIISREPNFNAPANMGLMQTYQTNRDKYEQEIKEMIKKCKEDKDKFVGLINNL